MSGTKIVFRFIHVKSCMFSLDSKSVFTHIMSLLPRYLNDKHEYQIIEFICIFTAIIFFFFKIILIILLVHIKIIHFFFVSYYDVIRVLSLIINIINSDNFTAYYITYSQINSLKLNWRIHTYFTNNRKLEKFG